MNDLLQKIRELLVAKHGRSAGMSMHMLTNADRDALVAVHGAAIVPVIRAHCNEPSWTPKAA